MNVDMYAQSPVIVIDDLASLLQNQHLRKPLYVRVNVRGRHRDWDNQEHGITSRGGWSLLIERTRGILQALPYKGTPGVLSAYYFMVFGDGHNYETEPGDMIYAARMGVSRL